MRIVILICVFISLIVIGFGGWYLIRLYKKTGATKSERAAETKPVSDGNPYDAIPEYEKQCGAEEEETLDCAWLKGLVVAQTVEALEDIEYSGDQRGVSEAMEALELEEEPEIQIAGLRILALFPNNPEMEPEILQLLFSPYVEVQRNAAQLLSRSYETNPALGGIGNQWRENHGGLQGKTPYDEMEIPSHYAQMGFPEYSGAIHFSPGDSDRSVGWITSNSASVVENELSTRLSVQPLGYQEWYDRSQQSFSRAVPAFDPAAMSEVQTLTEQYVKTQDPKILEQLQTLQKKMTEQMEKTVANWDKGVNKVSNPPNGIPADTIRYWIAEERDGRVSRLIVTYPQPALQQTVIQMVWDLNDYQTAWPETTK